MITVPHIQEMTHSFQMAQLAHLVHSCDTTCRGKNYCSRGCGACYCGGVRCFLSHCLSLRFFWHCLANVKFSNAYHPARSLPHNYSSITCLSSTQPLWSTPCYLVGAADVLMTVLGLNSLHYRPRLVHTPANMNIIDTYTQRCIHKSCTRSTLETTALQQTPPHNVIIVVYIYSVVRYRPASRWLTRPSINHLQF